MRGDLDNRGLISYAHEHGCYITGSSQGGRYLLYHYGDSHYINLKIMNNEFNGHDFGSNTAFNGKVTENLVSLYEPQENMYFEYEI